MARMASFPLRCVSASWAPQSIASYMLPIRLKPTTQPPSFRIPSISISRRSFRRRFYSSERVTASIPPRSLLRRVFKLSALSIIFTSAGFLIAASPAIAPMIALMSAPSDAEILGSYDPGDDLTTKIDSFIQNHPLTKSLRANHAYVESRPHLRLPETHRKHSLTAGILRGPGLIPVPPLVFCEEGKNLISICYLGTDMCGHIGVVHGGLLATLMDEGMAKCCFAALPNKIGLTARLTVNYRAPAPAGSFVVMKAEVVKVEGRKVWVEARIETLEEGVDGGKILVEGEGLFVEPKYARAMPKLLTVQA